MEGSISALAAVILPAGAAAEAGAFPPEAVRLPCPSLSLSLPLSLLSPVLIVSCAREHRLKSYRLHASKSPLCKDMLLCRLSAAFKDDNQRLCRHRVSISTKSHSIECTSSGASLQSSCPCCRAR